MSEHMDTDGAGDYTGSNPGSGVEWTVAGPVNHYSDAQWSEIKRTYKRRIWGIRVYSISDDEADDPPKHFVGKDPANVIVRDVGWSLILTVMLALTVLVLVLVI